MGAATFACPSCRTEFEASPATDHQAFSCPNCSTGLEAFFFPALFRERETGAPAAMLVDQTEASCFYHPQKQAAQICDGCGRMMCALCSVPMGQENLCPTCISAGRRKGKISTLESSRTCYDRVALSLAILGVLFCFISIFTSPTVIYLTVRHWNSPGSLLGSSRTRFVIALVLALLGLFEFVGWIGVQELTASRTKLP